MKTRKHTATELMIAETRELISKAMEQFPLSVGMPHYIAKEYFSEVIEFSQLIAVGTPRVLPADPNRAVLVYGCFGASDGIISIERGTATLAGIAVQPAMGLTTINFFTHGPLVMESFRFTATTAGFFGIWAYNINKWPPGRGPSVCT